MEEKMNLHQKLLKIANMAGVLQRSKSGFGYKYVPEEDIQAKVTAGLQKYGVMLYNYIVPGTLKVVPYTYEKYDKKIGATIPVNEILVYADTVYKWVNVDNPDEYIETPWAFVGQMEDAAQSFGAAETYSNRYYLMKQLQLATTESDPDAYRSKQKEAENYEENEAAKAEAEALKAEIQKVINAGSALIKSGIEKSEIGKIVAEFNDGIGNPSSIKSAEVCAKILAAFEKIKTKKEKGDK